MTGLVQKFEKHLEEKNMSERLLYSKIKEKLQEGYDVSQIDIESIFSVIQGIASKITPKEMGHFAYYYIHQFSNDSEFTNDEVKDAKKLQEELETFIKKECQFVGNDNEKFEIYENSYEALFKNLWGIKRYKNNKGFEYSRPWKAYTTNYDLIFEDYWAELAPLIDFFKIDGSQFAYFDKRLKQRFDLLTVR